MAYSQYMVAEKDSAESEMKSSNVGAYRGVCSKQREDLVSFLKIGIPAKGGIAQWPALSTPLSKYILCTYMYTITKVKAIDKTRFETVKVRIHYTLQPTVQPAVQLVVKWLYEFNMFDHSYMVFTPCKPAH